MLGCSQRRHRDWLRRHDLEVAERISRLVRDVGRVFGERPARSRGAWQRCSFPGSCCAVERRRASFQRELLSSRRFRDQRPFRGAEALDDARCRALSPPTRCSPGPSDDRGADLEHVPQSPDLGIRNPQVRGRSRASELVRAAQHRAVCAQGRAADQALRFAGGPDLVSTRHVSRHHEHSWHRVQRADGQAEAFHLRKAVL